MEVLRFAQEMLVPFAGIAVGLIALLKSLYVGRRLEHEKMLRQKVVETMKAELEDQLLETQARLDRESHVHRLGFEKEFQILYDMWGPVSKLRSAAISLRPNVEIMRDDESQLDRRKGRLDEFQRARECVVRTFMASKPFYALEIYNAVLPIIEAADQEYWDLSIWGESCLGHDDPGTAIDEKAQRLQFLEDAADDFCEKIRARVTA